MTRTVKLALEHTFTQSPSVGRSPFRACAMAFGAAMFVAQSAAGDVEVSSPDKAVRFVLAVAGGGLEYHIAFKGRPVIEPSALSITVDGVDLTRGADTGEAKSYEVNETYPWRGGHAEAKNHCHGATIPITVANQRFTHRGSGVQRRCWISPRHSGRSR